MSEWISVKDKLPPRDCEFKTFSIPVLFYYDGWILRGNYCFKNKTWYDNGATNENKITHWMPLPNPPEEK
jgi:hypothetical protein